jgi:hypothetical protein
MKWGVIALAILAACFAVTCAGAVAVIFREGSARGKVAAILVAVLAFILAWGCLAAGRLLAEGG